MSESPPPSPVRAFARRPHRTLLGMALPVLVSLIAEPLTGLVDTVFVLRTGAEAGAALGVGTALLSGTFWIFNGLAVGIQTTTARHVGAGDRDRAAALAGLALRTGLVCGLGVLVLFTLGAPLAAAAMAAEGDVAVQAGTYLRIRALGAPGVLAMLIAFGALRGLQDMRTPMVIATAVNALNIALDPVLIFGLGPVPALGIAGAAWASTASQVAGALWAVAAVRRRLGVAGPCRPGDLRALLRVGVDLFARTGLLTAFLLLGTRVATAIGPEAGAAHQVVRQVWVFTALFLDAWALVAQSLIAVHLGRGEVTVARHVARVCCVDSFLTGVLLAGLMLAATGWIEADWIRAPAVITRFESIWWIAALGQPVAALSFATDGIHWGSADYRFLRRAMTVATVVAGGGLLAIDTGADAALALVWWTVLAWVAIRAAFGMGRLWPRGSGPLAA